MRYSCLLGVVGVLVAVAVARPDVVLSNYGGTDGHGMVFSTTTPATITWTNAGFSGYFSRIKLRVYNSGTGTINHLNLSFGLDPQADSIVRSYVARAGDLSQNAYSDWEYDLGDSLTFNQGSSGTLYIKLVSQQEKSIGNWATTSNPVTASYSWLGGVTQNPTSGQFELSATAVPEPSTWLMLGLAQIMGGSLWIWYRRRTARNLAFPV